MYKMQDVYLIVAACDTVGYSHGMQSFGSKTIALTYDNCHPDEADTFTLTLSGTPEVGGDHYSVLDFSGFNTAQISWTLVISGTEVGISRTQGFMFTSAGETYTLKARLSSAFAMRVSSGDISLSQAISIIPYTVTAMYAPAWAGGTGEIVPTPEVQNNVCSEALMLVPSACAQFSGNKLYISDDAPAPYPSPTAYCYVTYSVDGVGGSTYGIFNYGYKVCYMNTPSSYTQWGSKSYTAEISLPANAVPLTAYSTGWPGGTKYWTITGTPSTPAFKKIYTNNPGSACVYTYNCYATGRYAGDGASGTTRQTVTGTSPCTWSGSTEVNPSLNSNSFDFTTDMSPTEDWDQLEFTQTINQTYSGVGGSATFNATITKVRCQTTVRISGTSTASANGAYVVNVPLSPSTTSDSDSSYHDVGTVGGRSCKIQVNMNGNSSKGHIYGTDCNDAFGGHYSVDHSVSITPYIRIGAA